MAKSLLSASWYRVAGLKPRLRAHAEMHRQRFRGQTWYVLQDHQSGQFHRVSPMAHWMICRMDGRRTMREIWEQAAARVEEDKDQPTQDETIQLLAQLHNADLLSSEVPPDMAELARRSDRQRSRTLMSRLRNPLAIRLPLVDPDRFLDTTMPLLRPAFTAFGFVVWIAVVATGIVLAAVNWESLVQNVFDHALTAQNFALILATYPVIKAIHELGHAYATKAWGGEVHEMGVMVLVLLPVPYVDASASSAFRNKWQRAAVASAGIMVEALLAAAAMIFWALAEPGIGRAIAFNIMLIGGVSTLLFNGNPLLRYDGYYVLSDLIEIPNLGSRANRYLFYLVQRYGFGVEDAVSPVTARGEAAWFACYAVAAFCYRVFVTIGIALFVASQLFFIGVALAIGAAANFVVTPLFKGIKYLATSPQLRHRRQRAAGVSALAALGVAVLLFAVPVPYGTIAEGVVWLPERASVHALTDGFIVRLVARPGGMVAAGAPLAEMDDSELAAHTAILEAQLAELELRLDAVRMADQVQAKLVQEQIRHTGASLALSRQRMVDLVVRAPNAGTFIVPDAADLPGRFLRKGGLLGYVVSSDDLVVRVVVTQETVDLVRHRTRAVALRRVEMAADALASEIIREVPAAQVDLPSMALSSEGGGTIALDPSSREKPKSLEPLFQFDIRLPKADASTHIGARAFVRFDHGPEGIAFRLIRAGRQLFLSHFNV